MENSILIQKLAPLLYSIIVLAGVVGSIKCLLSGKVKEIINIVIACVILIIFVSKPDIFIALVEKLINFISSIATSLNVDEIKELSE